VASARKGEFGLKKLIENNFRWFTRKLREDAVDSYSAQVSFFIIIAFIPFITLLLSLLQSVRVGHASLLTALLGFMPESLSEFVQSLFSTEIQPIAIVSVSAVTCLWSASMATLALIKGLNSVFDAPKHRGIIWLRFVAVLYTLVFVVMLAFCVLLLIFGNTIYESIFHGRGPASSDLMMEWKSVIAFLILAIFFTFSFQVLPLKTKVSLKHCAIGGSLASLGWVLFSFFFSLFVSYFGNYSAVYGSLAALVIFMLWLYFCMYIMFLGGEVAVWLERGPILKDFRRWRDKRMKQNHRS
jgi:membrane protein